MMVLAGLPGRSFERGKLLATKRSETQNQNQTMKLLITFLSLAAAIWTPVSASASVGKVTSASGLRRTQYNATPNTNEVCFSSPKNYSQPELALLHSLAAIVADDSFTGVTPPGQGVPHYALGCRFLDFKCYACDLCEDIYGTLVKTGSEVACDLACVGIAEAAGGGPEDRTYQRVARGNCVFFSPPPSSAHQRSFLFGILAAIADMVAAACIPLCKAVFSAVGGGSAKAVCTKIF
jgi:hypothetical protein